MVAVKPERTRTHIKLTDDRARKATKTIWDADIKGFHVRVTPAGGRFFRVRFQRTDGKKVCATLGPVENWSVEDPVDENGDPLLDSRGNKVLGARTWARDRRKAFETKKEHPGKEAKATKAAPDLNAWVEVWRVSEKGKLKLKTTTQASYESLLTKHILPLLGDKKLRSINEEDVNDLHEAVAVGGHTTNANRAVAVLSNLLKRAAIAGKITKGTNPCLGFEKSEESKRERTFKPKEYAALEAALVQLGTAWLAANEEKDEADEKQEREDTLDPAAADLIRFLALSGLRKSEAANLKFGDVDLDRNSMSFVDHKTSKKKGKKVLPLNPSLRVIIKRREEALGKVVSTDPFFVFPGKLVTIGEVKKQGPIVGLAKMWSRVMKTAGLLHATNTPVPHDLRRTFQTVCIDLGYTTAIGDILLGHSLGAIRDTYIRLDTDGVLGLASTDTSNWIAAAMAGKKVKPYEKITSKAKAGTA